MSQIEKNTFAFLKNIAKNNNREWFTENKPDYQVAREPDLSCTMKRGDICDHVENQTASMASTARQNATRLSTE